MSLDKREMSWFRRGAIVLLALWLMIEVPIVCHHGPLNLLDLDAHKGHIQRGSGSAADQEAAVIPRSGFSLPAPVGTALRLILLSPNYGLSVAPALQTGVSLSEGMLPTLPLVPLLGSQIAFIVAFFLFRRLLPLPPPDNPPRPLPSLG